MDTNKINPKPTPDDDEGSKWQELANIVARKNREISIIKDVENDPVLKKIHSQKNKTFSDLPSEET